MLLIILCNFALAQTSSMQNETAAYDKLFDAINTKRFGLEPKVFISLKDPFIASSKLEIDSDEEVKPKEVTYTLYGIMENSAKINNSWIAKGEMLDDLRLVKVTGESAILSNAQRTITLMLSQKGTGNVVITSK